MIYVPFTEIPRQFSDDNPHIVFSPVITHNLLVEETSPVITEDYLWQKETFGLEAGITFLLSFAFIAKPTNEIHTIYFDSMTFDEETHTLRVYGVC